MTKSLKNYNKVFFIGIGGISMSGLAIILKSFGKVVIGSDLQNSYLIKNLKKRGIKVFLRHKATNIKGCDLVVFSGAIKEDNEELCQAKRMGIDTIERSELLYLISKNYKNVIAVSGTHGKTTTTAMIGHVFNVCGLNPTIHVGGEVKSLGENVSVGGKEYFITEACEFRDSFLTLSPHVSIVNNVEPEHLDYFCDFENEKKSFLKFCQKTKGLCFINERYNSYFKGESNVRTFGLNGKGELFATNIEKGEDYKYSFDCYYKDKYVGRFKLGIYGFHNIENALATIGVCLKYKIDYQSIYLGLKSFEGVKRRFDKVGIFGNNIVLHDYAHHPTEIEATIRTCKEVFNGKNIICVFQPHTYSRTKSLIDDFGRCFEGVDRLFVLKTYSAREEYDYYGSAEYLKKSLLMCRPTFDVDGVFNNKNILHRLRKGNFCNCVILFLGAGDIVSAANKLGKK